MMFMVDPDVLLLTIFATGALLWLASTFGPSLRLCSCTPEIAHLANRLMLVRGTEEIVGLYILNYSLLLLWGIASVLVEALFENKNDFTSFFSSFFALVIGSLCAIVHICMPVRRRLVSRQAGEAVHKNELVPFETVVGCLVEQPDGSSALAVHRAGSGSEAASEALAPKPLASLSEPLDTSEGSSSRIHASEVLRHGTSNDNIPVWGNPVYVGVGASSHLQSQATEDASSEDEDPR